MFENCARRCIFFLLAKRRQIMKFKTLAIALALTALPTLSLAMGCSYGKEKQAMSCAAGSSYDTASQSCVPVTT